MLRIALTAVAAVVLTAPALADVKTGVEAWQRGDYQRAVAEWRGPAERGNPDAQFNLAQAYKLGRGVPRDLKQAELWYGRAAVQNHPQAQDNYGLALFENGHHAEAIRWLTISAERGEPRAQFVLGSMYFNGDSVAKDYPRAYALLSRAASSGLPRARDVLAQIDPFISLKDKQRGVELARQYEAGAQSHAVAMAAPPPPAPREKRRKGTIRTAQLPPSSAYQPTPMDAPDGDDTAPATDSPPPAAPPKPVVKRAPERVAANSGRQPARPTPPAPSEPAIKSTEMTASAPPAAARPAPSPAPTRVVDGGWVVQLGAFGEPGNAQKLWRRVGGRFPNREVSYVKAGRLTLVLVGPFGNSAEAHAACRRVSPCIPKRR